VGARPRPLEHEGDREEEVKEAEEEGVITHGNPDGWSRGRCVRMAARCTPQITPRQRTCSTHILPHVASSKVNRPAAREHQGESRGKAGGKQGESRGKAGGKQRV
jgi:hypothetical protein